MPPKSASKTAPVAADTRSAVEIELDRTNALLDSLNDQLQRCKDGMNELSVVTSRIRSLEQELQPKEGELKSINAAFSKVVEGASSLKRPSGMLRTQQAVINDDDVAAAPSVAAPSGQNVSPPQSQQGSRPSTVAAPLLGGAAPAPPQVPPPPQATAADESNDREALRVLANASKSAMLALIQSVYEAPVTMNEKRAEQEGMDIITQYSSKVRAEQAGRVDMELTCPVGLEVAVFNEALKLRAQRIVADRAVGELQAQINDARAIVNKRKDEGASKVLQKKLEKQIEDTRKRLSELQREKEENENTASGGVNASVMSNKKASVAPESPLKRSASRVNK